MQNISSIIHEMTVITSRYPENVPKEWEI